jgi:hypothetical protein
LLNLPIPIFILLGSLANRGSTGADNSLSGIFFPSFVLVSCCCSVKSEVDFVTCGDCGSSIGEHDDNALETCLDLIIPLNVYG